jgi:hypothetical protein
MNRDLEWAVWKRGERTHFIPPKTKAERSEEERRADDAPAPKPEDYVKA